MGNLIYDAVFIGASPISALEAIHLKSRGRRVAVIDMADGMGGAWKVTEFAGHKNVDIGPHFLMTAYDRHHFLEQLGVELVPYKQKWAYNHKVFSKVIKGPISNRCYSFFEAILIPWSIIKGVFSGGINPHHLKYKIRCLKDVFKPENMNKVYFRKGTVDFLNRIERLIHQTELETHYGIKVERIEKEELFSIHTNASKTFQAKSLFITEHTQIDAFIHNGERVELTLKKKTPQFLHLEMDDCPALACDFLRFYNYDKMVMLSDVTQFIEGATSRILVLRVKGIETEQDVVNLTNRLRADGILPKAAKLKSWQTLTYDNTEIQSLDSLRKIPDVHVVEADSLSKALCHYAPKWLSAGVARL